MQQAQQIQGDSVQEVCRVKASSGKAQVRHNAQGENRGGEEIRCGTLQSDVTLNWAQGGEGSSKWWIKNRGSAFNVPSRKVCRL